MGFWNELTGRAHKERMQQNELAAKEREADASRASQERIAEAQERTAQAKIRSAEQEAARNRTSQERIAQTNKEKAIAEAEIHAALDKFAIDKENELKIVLAQKQVETDAKEQEELTHRLELEKNAELRQSELEEAAETERVRIKENAAMEASKHESSEATERIRIEEASQQAQTRERAETERAVAAETTKQVVINANRDIAVAEKERQIKSEALSAMKDMFTSYLQVISETHKADIELLLSVNEKRKEKFLASLETARAEKKQLLELSKEAKGQEKLNYLNESREIEKTIRNLQEEDKEADVDLIGTLAMLRDKQQREVNESQTKLTNTDTLFLNYTGDAEK